MPAPNTTPDLSGFLRFYRSGQWSDLDQSQYDYWGGDDILKALQKYDPDARWDYGVDDNGVKTNYNLKYDQSKLPGNKFGDFLNMKPIYTDHNELYDPKLQYKDENWGQITHTRNVKKPTDPLWTKVAPLVPGIVAPWAAGLLAASGVGAAGLASSVTGSGLAGGAGSGWGSSLVRGLPGIGRSIASGDWSNLGQTAAGVAGGAMGVPQLGTAVNLAKTGYNLTRSR